jgi:hypothetical protein
MNKQALLNIDPRTVGRYAAGGAATGASAAAILDLLHTARSLNEERKKKRELETDENTIVLTLPHKSAEVSGTAKEPTKIRIHAGSQVKERLLRAGKTQSRTPHNGTYSQKIAATGWPTLTASSLAAIGGAGAGAAIVDKIYQVRREKQLKAELDAAKQEYMSALSGGKTAASIENLFGVDSDEKQADSQFGMLSYPIAATALLTILGAGGAGYLTKKILDEKLRDTEEKSIDVPKVKRIVFRTAPEADQSKHASVEEVEAVKAAFVIMLDAVGQTDRYLGQPAVKRAMADAKTSYETLTKMALNDVDDTRAFLEAHPNLTSQLAQHATQGKGWLARTVAKTPIGRHMVINRATDMVRGLATKQAQTAGSGGCSGAVGGNQGPSPRTQINKKKRSMQRPIWMKASQALEMAGSGVVSNLIRKTEQPTADDIASAIQAKQDETAKQKHLESVRVPGTVQLQAGDPEAAKYLTHNQQKIVSVVKRLAAEGQL